jgi:ketosteroid isomerase-like protein
MSQENVEIVRRAYTAFNDGDLGTALGFFDPDIEWNASDVFFDQPRTYRGRLAWQEEFLRDLMEVFAGYRADLEELIDAGDRVVAVVRVGGPGRRSGASATARVGHVLTFSDGKLVRFTEFKEPREALEAAGLRE